MMGDEIPGGADTFHFTFLSGPTSVGGVWPSATPEPFGPRNRDQASDSAPVASAATNTNSEKIAANSFIDRSLLKSSHQFRPGTELPPVLKSRQHRRIGPK